MDESEDLNYVINILMSTYLTTFKDQFGIVVDNPKCVDELADIISDVLYDPVYSAVTSSFTADEISDIAEYNRKYIRHIESLALNLNSLVQAKLNTEEYSKKFESVMDKYEGEV